MIIPGAKKYEYQDGFDDEDGWQGVRIYSFSRRRVMTPNSQGAVTLVCDDGVRRCKTVSQWALLCERSKGEEK